MGYRYNLNDRILAGSMDPRLNPDCVDPRLNVKLRPSPWWPDPMVRYTCNGKELNDPRQRKRLEDSGIRRRFIKD